jgi:Spy/CpxP family protein refolding chaperone
MKRNVLKVFSVAALATGMVWAQDAPATTQAPEQPQVQMGRRGRGNMMGRFAADLNLTDAQKTQAAQIFQDARRQTRPLAQELRQDRQDLAAAVKSGGTPDQIDAVTAKMGPLVSQMASIHAKAFQKFYGTLTPEQQQKIGEHMGRFLAGGMMNYRMAHRGWRQQQQ